MLGSGKTTSALAVALLVKRKALELNREKELKENSSSKFKSKIVRKVRNTHKFRKRGDKDAGGELNSKAPLFVFCCPVDGVVQEFAEALDNAGVKFVVVALDRASFYSRNLRLVQLAGVAPSKAHAMIITPEALLAFKLLVLAFLVSPLCFVAVWLVLYVIYPHIVCHLFPHFPWWYPRCKSTKNLMRVLTASQLRQLCTLKRILRPSLSVNSGSSMMSLFMVRLFRPTESSDP